MYKTHVSNSKPSGFFFFFPRPDLLRGQPGGRLGVLGHRVSDRREGQHRDDRRDRRGGQPGLRGQQRAREPGGVQHAVGADGGQADRRGDQHEGDARHAGRSVRQRGATQLGVRRGRGAGPVGQARVSERVAGHRQTAGRGGDGPKPERECPGPSARRHFYAS